MSLGQRQRGWPTIGDGEGGAASRGGLEPPPKACPPAGWTPPPLEEGRSDSRWEPTPSMMKMQVPLPSPWGPCATQKWQGPQGQESKSLQAIKSKTPLVGLERLQLAGGRGGAQRSRGL